MALLKTFGIILGIVGIASTAHAQLGCTGPNGNIFNLEPRPNALVQASRSVAFLPGAGVGGDDLVVGTATDMRGIGGANNGDTANAFYVERANANCAADFEGGVPPIQDQFVGESTPIVTADPAHGAFFLTDIRFGGVGIIRTTAATLLSSSACPSGTQSQGSASCWPVGVLAAATPSLDIHQDSPAIAVDQRTSGKGAGDVYVVVGQSELATTDITNEILLTACTNAQLNCGNPIVISSSSDSNADYPYVQVEPDGAITVSYRNTTFPVGIGGVNPEEIEFVKCTPNGAPTPPTCAAPVIVATENNPVFVSFPGDVPMAIELYPRHVDRLESDGKTITTFMVWDRCQVPILEDLSTSNFCPKSDVVLTSSTNGGESWSPIETITPSAGQQFFSSIALDVSTGVVNLAYYSTENDPFQQRPQVFLAQVPAGSSTPGAPQLLTADFGDVQAISPLGVLDEPTGFGDRLGLAVSGTGAAGQSRVYCGFTWNSVMGTYNGTPNPDMNNHLVQFTY